MEHAAVDRERIVVSLVNELDAAGKVAAVDGNGNRIGLTFSAVNTHSPEWYWNRLDTKPVNLV